MNGTTDSQPSPALNWEIVSMHLVKPTVNSVSCICCNGCQMQSTGAPTTVPSTVTNPPFDQVAAKSDDASNDTPSGDLGTQSRERGSRPTGYLAAPATPPVQAAVTLVEDQRSRSSTESSWVEATPTPARRTDGYFSETSKNIRLDGSILQADCLALDNQTYQPSSLDLNEILSNDDGSFAAHFGEWSMSAQNIKLDGTMLTADLRRIDCDWNAAQTLDLDLHIANDGGVLKLAPCSS
ncbi:hypothetical protein FRB94_013645 [Tulasnella sp. JGI-2019a]|nr:hypothetical protein FRB94_013645 [Tulasnella sp. JGI-2019a]